MEFGPRRQSYHPEYPFWRLQNDGIWEVNPAEGLATRSSNTDAKKSELIEQNVHGGFVPEIYDRLSEDHQLALEVVRDILDNRFDREMHPKLIAALGLDRFL